MSSLETIYLKSEVMDQNSVDELIGYFRENNSRFVNWQRYINEVMQLHGCSYEKFGKMTGFSKNTIKSWCTNGTIPRSRNMFIKLAFGLKMNVDETNTLLYKYGKYSKLYAKDLHDAIVIYVINRRIDNWEDKRFAYDSLEMWEEKFEYILKNHKIENHYYNQPDTTYVFNELSSISNDEDFEKYVNQNSDVFFSSYSKLIYFIDDFIKIRTSEKNITLDEKCSWHKYIKEKHLDSSFEIMLSRLKHDGVLPRREQLIALGIHLNMTAIDIDKMLSLANMHELYAHDKAEAMIMFLLRNADEIDPDIQLNNAWKYISITSDNRIKAEYKDLIERYYGCNTEIDWDDCIEDLSVYMYKELSEHSADEIINTYIKI